VDRAPPAPPLPPTSSGSGRCRAAAFIVPPVEPCVVVGPASIFTQTAEMHESPGSHAPPEVHAQPSAPNAQLVAVVEEQAVHKKESAARQTSRPKFGCLSS